MKDGPGAGVRNNGASAGSGTSVCGASSTPSDRIASARKRALASWRSDTPIEHFDSEHPLQRVARLQTAILLEQLAADRAGVGSEISALAYVAALLMGTLGAPRGNASTILHQVCSAAAIAMHRFPSSEVLTWLAEPRALPPPMLRLVDSTRTLPAVTEPTS